MKRILIIVLSLVTIVVVFSFGEGLSGGEPRTLCSFQPTIQIVPLPPICGLPFLLYGFGNQVTSCNNYHPRHMMMVKFRSDDPDGPQGFWSGEYDRGGEDCPGHIGGTAPAVGWHIDAWYRVWCKACWPVSGKAEVTRSWQVVDGGE